MTQPLWSRVDGYLDETFALTDAALEAALQAARKAGMPDIQVAPNQGRLLQILACSVGARRILELGTLGGYSAIWLARALPPGGRLLTLEIDPARAALARENLARAGLDAVAEVRIGAARDTLAALTAAGEAPFDFIFVDADKPALPEYFASVLPLTRPGTLIVVDNVIRSGAVADPSSTDPSVLGVRRFNVAVAAEPRVLATVLQTVGTKGHDGFALVLVTG